MNKETTCLDEECALSGQAPIACCDCVTGLILEQVSYMLNTCRGSALQRKYLAPGESLLHPAAALPHTISGIAACEDRASKIDDGVSPRAGQHLRKAAHEDQLHPLIKSCTL